tara:strand:- start:15767 stop:16945 length:1179 start_codon:yes stop_codon:yes gene_type:complete
MSSDFIPYGRQTITQGDIDSVIEVLRSPFITQGPAIENFEFSLSDVLGAPHTVAVSSATAALHLACLALDLGPSDWVWTSPITFVASSNCALYCGAKIDFVDIDRSTGLISIDSLERKLAFAKAANKLPKAVIPVHLAGSPCDMESIKKLADIYKFFVIEDASHAIGSSYRSSPVGSCQFSDMAVFSFHPVKIVTTGEGGAVTTRDSQIASKLKALRTHGIIKDQSSFIYPAAGPWSYEQQFLGYNYRMTDIQAALGISQLQRLTNIVAERNSIRQRYVRELSEMPIRILLNAPHSVSSVHLVILDLLRSNADYHRQVFCKLRELGIGVQLHYSPVHLQPYYRNLGFKPGDFPNAEDYAINAISLPVYPGLTSESQSRVIYSIISCIEGCSS